MNSSLPLCTDNYTTNQFFSNKINTSKDDINLNIAVVNCRSILANRASFLVFVENHYPDMVSGDVMRKIQVNMQCLFRPNTI